MVVGLDWASFERVLVDGLVQAVRSTIAEHPDERFYAAALDRIYRETDGQISLPSLAMNSVEALARLPAEEQTDVRWSAADWDHYDDEWLAEDLTRDWARQLTAEACRGTPRQWEATFRRYLSMLVRVCKRASVALRTSGVTDRDFVVLLLDDEYHETLIKRVLTGLAARRHPPARGVRARRTASRCRRREAGPSATRTDGQPGPGRHRATAGDPFPARLAQGVLPARERDQRGVQRPKRRRPRNRRLLATGTERATRVTAYVLTWGGQPLARPCLGCRGQLVRAAESRPGPRGRRMSNDPHHGVEPG